jgi:hypothetical protein
MNIMSESPDRPRVIALIAELEACQDTLSYPALRAFGFFTIRKIRES